MNPIQPPLRQGDRGLKVTNLQEALLFLLSEAPTRFGFPDAGSAAALVPKIESEKATSVFGDATKAAVLRFQGANQLERSGIVDDPTARALNELLKELGAFPEVPVTETGSDEPRNQWGQTRLILVKNKLVLVQTLAHCIIPPNLNPAEGEHRPDNHDAHERKITNG